METSDEVVTVLLVETHEGATHDNEFNLISIMSETFKLLNSILSLQIWVIAGSYSSHRGWFISCIGLC